MIPCVSYLRVSGNGQVEGDGFPRQRAAAEKYAAANDLEIVQEFRDEGVPGKTELEDRPGLAACLERIENNGVKLVIVESADRLARDSLIAELIIRQFQKVGGRVISASGGVDLTAGDDSNPTAKLIRQILASVAEFDRCVVTLKLRAARQRQTAKTGRCEGRKPFGTKSNEVSTLAEMQRLQKEGIDANGIAATLNAQQIQTRYGKSWRASTIRKILARFNEVTAA